MERRRGACSTQGGGVTRSPAVQGAESVGRAVAQGGKVAGRWGITCQEAATVHLHLLHLYPEVVGVGGTTWHLTTLCCSK